MGHRLSHRKSVRSPYLALRSLLSRYHVSRSTAIMTRCAINPPSSIPLRSHSPDGEDVHSLRVLIIRVHLVSFHLIYICPSPPFLRTLSHRQTLLRAFVQDTFCKFILTRLFCHLVNDAISWAVLQVIKMNEGDTTSSSCIFVKIMTQEVTKSMGLPTLKERFVDPEINALYTGMSPLDNPQRKHFSINYFTSIGLWCPYRRDARGRWNPATGRRG